MKRGGTQKLASRGGGKINYSQSQKRPLDSKAKGQDNDAYRDVSENDYYRENPSVMYDDEDESYPHGVTSDGEGDDIASSIEEMPLPKQRPRSRSRHQKPTHQ
jgi:hypothetical protein